MCWRTRSFSGWVSDQFHPASSGCEKNCQHQCFVLGGRVGNKGVFWPMGLMDCGSLSTQTPHRHCSVDSPFVPWTIPKFSFHHGKDTAGGVSLSSFNHCLVIKTTATHSFLSPPPSFGTCNLQWPILVFHKNGDPEGWICLFTCVKEKSLPWTIYHEATQKKTQELQS